MANPNSYDEVPYESNPFAQTHPDRLAVIGHLLGLRVASPRKCRVLEIGCAAGGNLIPMAYQLPGSQFVGIDLSKVQVDEGLETVKALGLTNIDLKQLSILDVTPALGKFDYILCHGVYSWVPPPCQEKILEICNSSLNPQGIAYISYNTYPGWHMRGMIRDMLFYHASQFTVAAMKVRQARNLLDFLGKATSKDNTAYAHLLRGELESFRRSSDSYLYHEHLEEHNEPIYFYQFAERAAAAGLKYLGEADLRVMVPGNFPPEIENVLQMLAQDMIHLEQYMDFLRNRMFRQTLLVHKNATPNYQLKWEQLRAFHVGSPARMRSEGATGGARGDGEAAVAPPAPLDSDSPLLFETPEGITLQSREPIVKAAMVVLSEIWPGNMRFGDLVEAARKKLAATGAEPTDERKQAEGLGQAILQFHASAGSSLVELWFDPPTFEWTAGEKPLASALAREQAKTKSRVTNRRHESVNLGDFERQLLGKLDGTRDRATLVQELSKLADGQNSGPQEAPGSSWTMAEIVEKQLAMMGRSALLEAPAPIP